MKLKQIIETFEYCSKTGVVSLKNPNIFGTKKCGWIDNYKRKYIRICHGGKFYYAHRIAWILFHKRKIPKKFVIDHINGNGIDNRIENLRLSDLKGNARNQRPQKSNKSGYRGVSFSKKMNKFRAYIYVNNKQLHIGFFEKSIDAAIAYDRHSRMLHGEFGRPNFKKEK